MPAEPQGGPHARPTRILIVQFGEGVPVDANYRTGRHGRLARYLTELGHDVTRVAPSFRHDSRTQRELGEFHSNEGRAVIVPTASYQSNRGIERVRFIADLIRETVSVVRVHKPDVVLAGTPPPGMVAAVRTAAPRARVVADVRDLWPDALAPSRNSATGMVAAGLGRLLRTELYFASAAVGISSAMVNRVPSVRRGPVIPIGIDETMVGGDHPEPQGPVQICFVGNIGYQLDFEPLLQALTQAAHPWRLDIYGRGPRVKEIQDRIADLDGASFRGELAPSQVPIVLARYDVGVVPRVEGFGTAMSNKVFEYLGAGLRVFFRLEPGVGDELIATGLGELCTTAADWLEALELQAASLEHYRGERQTRIERSLDRYAGSRVDQRFADTLLGT